MSTEQQQALVPTEQQAPAKPQLPTAIIPEFGMNILQIGATLAKSGMFGKALTPEQAVAKMMIGQQLGLAPIVAIQNIDVFDGNIFMRANLRAAKINGTPGYEYRIMKHDDNECAIEFIRNGEPLGISTFTMADAKKAGLVKQGGAYEKSPRNMLFARALSNGQRWYMPEVMGGQVIYDETEREEIVVHAEPVANTAPLRQRIAQRVQAIDAEVVPEPTPVPTWEAGDPPSVDDPFGDDEAEPELPLK